MEQYIYFLFLLSIVGITNAESNYTWENYYGTIPTYALLAGYGENKTPMYIGKGVYHNVTIPGKIYGNDSNVYFEYGKLGLTTDKEVQILCTENAENFLWIPTDINGILQLRHETAFVDGGEESNYLVLIGRTFLHDDVVEVGKIVCPGDYCWGFFINKDGESKDFENDFEVLTYKSPTENNVTD